MAILFQSRICFVFVRKNVEKNCPTAQLSRWSKLYMYFYIMLCILGTTF